jgi:aspartyl-tRNA(Asn)/glutamyl-tRNA(Gln) amidotransferase subunit A
VPNDTDEPTHPADLGVLAAAQALRDRRLSALELTEACLERIAERNGGEPTFDGAPGAINAWIRLYPDLARDQAREADARRAREGADAPLLCGIPIGVKDLIGVGGLPLTGSSRVMEGHVAPRDSVAWRRLRARGMVLLGHTHTHELGAGGTTDQVGNPWNLAHSAGGSSGGNGAALAARMVPAAIGTDGAGSLRIPAAMSGISSVKPTYARVPNMGDLPMMDSFSHIGPMARTAADCAPLLEALAGEPGHPAAFGGVPHRPRGGAAPLRGVRIALTDRPAAFDVDSEVLDGLDAARTACERLGAEVVELPAAPGVTPDDAVTLIFSEAWTYFREHPTAAGPYRTSIREFAELAERTHDPQAWAAADLRRGQVTAGWSAWFAEHRVDAILEPTCVMPAPPRGHGYDSGQLGGVGDPLIVLTSTWNFTGFPAVALPAGVGARSGLPVGVSLVGLPDAEPALVQLAIDLQERELAPPVAPLAAA